MIFLLLAFLLTAAALSHADPDPKQVTQEESDAYLAELRRRVQSVWKYPNGSENLQATVKFDLNRDGYVSDVVITKSSGRNDFDASVLHAVKKASPFPPIPEQLMQDAELRKVEMTFSRKSEPEFLKKQKPKLQPPRPQRKKQTPGIQI